MIKSYNNTYIDFYTDFALKLAYKLEIPCTKTVLKTKIKKWCVLKSPFVYKKAMEIYERMTHKRKITIYDTGIKKLNLFQDYLEKNKIYDIDMQFDHYEYCNDIEQLIKEYEGKNITLPSHYHPSKILGDAIAEAFLHTNKDNNETVESLGPKLHKQLFNKEIPQIDLRRLVVRRREQADRIKKEMETKHNQTNNDP